MNVNTKWCQNKVGFKHFFVQQHKEETAETSTANDEAGPKNDQLREPKIEISKAKRSTELAREVQMAAVRSTKEYVLFTLWKIKCQVNLTWINLFYFCSR